MEPCDIGIALGNALDNAIEAVRDCRQHQKVIEISMGVKKQALVMLIKNPYEHVLKNDRSGKYQSTKTESGRHAQDSVFCLTVVMNLPENWQLLPYFWHIRDYFEGNMIPDFGSWILKYGAKPRIKTCGLAFFLMSPSFKK